jgi:hypothetical protein
VFQLCDRGVGGSTRDRTDDCASHGNAAETSCSCADGERVIAYFKSWRIFHTDYRRRYATYREAYDAARGLFFFSITWGFE